MRLTVSTPEAAWLTRQDPKSFHRWARDRHLEPLRTVRIGRSWVTLWSVAAITAATRRAYAGQTAARRGEIAMLPVECPTSEVA